MGDQGQLTFEDAVEVLADLATRHAVLTSKPLSSLVLIGETALAAHAIRERSHDIDLYAAGLDDRALIETTKHFASRFGLQFKIDATPSNTIFGAIALADIETSPVLRTLHLEGQTVQIRSLSPETLYIVKAAANRIKDIADLRQIAPSVTYESVLDRAKQLFPWYADRSAFPEHAERLARHLAIDFAVPLEQVDLDFGLAEAVKQKIDDIRTGLDAQFLNALQLLMRRHHRLISFDPSKPHVLVFDANAAKAPDELKSIARRFPEQTSDMAALALKSQDPARHADWLRNLLHHKTSSPKKAGS